MNELTTWLAARGRAHTRRPDLLAALLTDRVARYALHRLRYLPPTVLLRMALSAAEVAFLARMLPWQDYAPLLGLRSAAALLGAGHFGALESLRSEVRAQLRAHAPHAARASIAAWLRLSLVLAGLCMALPLLLAPSVAAHGLTLAHAYAIACALRLGLEMVANAYHSGIFALRRVYRPYITVALPDVLELLGMLALWRTLGAWSIPLMIGVCGCLRAGWTFVYARRSYRTSRLTPLRVWPRPRQRFLPAGDSLRGALVHAGAGMLTQLDALLVLALVKAPGAASLAALSYALRPVGSASHAWTRTFYFDFKRLEHGFARAFLPRFHALLTRVAVGVALTACLSLVPFALLFWGADVPVLALWLLPLLLFRSLFALGQARAFALGRYRELGCCSGVVVLASMLSSRLGGDAVLALPVIVLGFALGAASFRLFERLRTDAAWHVGGLAGFLAELAREGAPTTLGHLTIDARAACGRRVAAALATLLGPANIVALGPRHLLWRARQGAAPELTQLVACSGGALLAAGAVTGATGPCALRALDAAGIPEQVLRMRLVSEGDDAETLRSSFAQQFPQGVCLDFAAARGAFPADWLAGAQLRTLLRAIVASARGQKPRHARECLFDVAVYAPLGEPVLSFAVARGTAGFSSFERRVRRATLTSSLRAK